VSEQLQHYGLAELAQVLDKPTMLLSAVQQRAVAILREAWAKPAVLMIDEPTADLEGYEAFLLLDVIKQIGQQRSVLLSRTSSSMPRLLRSRCCCSQVGVSRKPQQWRRSLSGRSVPPVSNSCVPAAALSPCRVPLE
jgi:ABC-type methionine transport system ATPase subunit